MARPLSRGRGGSAGASTVSGSWSISTGAGDDGSVSGRSLAVSGNGASSAGVAGSLVPDPLGGSNSPQYQAAPMTASAKPAAIDHTRGYGHIIEMEILTDEAGKQEALRALRNKFKELNIEITPREEFEKKYEEYKKSWKILLK